MGTEDHFFKIKTEIYLLLVVSGNGRESNKGICELKEV